MTAGVLTVSTAGKLGSFVLGGAGLGLYACDARCASAGLALLGAAAGLLWAGLLAAMVARSGPARSRRGELNARLDSSLAVSSEMSRPSTGAAFWRWPAVSRTGL